MKVIAAEIDVEVSLHPHGEHVVGPDANAQNADGDSRRHHDGVPENHLSGEHRDNFGCVREARNNQDVDLGMAKEPEEVLPEDRIPTGLGVEEMRAQEAIEEQHHLGGGEGRHGQQDEERNHNHHPHE